MLGMNDHSDDNDDNDYDHDGDQEDEVGDAPSLCRRPRPALIRLHPPAVHKLLHSQS